jgi:hypothetical protein
MSDNTDEGKKEEPPQNISKDDKEIEVIMQEYASLRAEIGYRYSMHSQFTNIAFLLIGGITAVASLFFSFDSHGIQLRVEPLYLIIILLIISFIFTTLLCASLLQLLEFRHIGSYTIQSIRKRVLEILGLDESESIDITWDNYHSHVASPLQPKKGEDKFLMWMLTLSPYTVMAVPALLSLGFGIWLFFANFPTLLTNLGGWIVLIFVFIGIDFLYFSMSAWGGFRIIGNFKEIQFDWPPQK